MLNPSLARRTYDAIALFAILNMIALGGIFVYIVSTGAVDGGKLERLGAVLRGEDQEEPTEPAPGPEELTEEAAPRASGEDLVAESEIGFETMRREAERIKEELRQRLALNNSILLRATTERETFRQEREAALAQSRAVQQKRQEEGFEKQVAILSAMKPKVAVEHLLGMGGPDEAARVLLQMSTRKAKKLVEAARPGEQMKQMMVVLQRIREVAPNRSVQINPEAAPE